ncbi:hypothetical protein FA15DRAFT_671365 [Coprinopsis marcescibilis]|uniref:DH domain-containing protein n=1 Tax=Coprinopsis marcescibilis TaxID=230819 RepID=A0A5C3KPV5_COPMA|nr:hypothetical protein FA15DRAFT_671365 [Coprinopsis marcescibilis]
MATVDMPRSDLVPAETLTTTHSQPPAPTTTSDQATTTTATTTTTSTQVVLSLSRPPVVPLRSPLRPPARSISSQHTASSRRASADSPPFSVVGETAMNERDSLFASIDDLLDAVNGVSVEQSFPKSLAVRPDSPIAASLDARSRVTRKSDSSSSTSSGQTPAAVSSKRTMTKRQHALHELLSSERAYASDLALIREVHIPLALGQTVPIQNLPASPPNSSASSSRTLSTASDSSTASLGPPMTQEDARTIFSNISELALFSDMFSEELEAALGALVEGGTGDDCVGDLFLRITPDLERPYQYYITRHPTALQHLHALPQTPALQAYLAYTQTVASSLSHAWDLASLLIKPVQRLLKYPLLLSAIIDETPDQHPDKQNLKDARSKMEEVARNVNEIRRRAEVVKDVLTSKKKPVNVTVAATVNLSKMKNLRPGTAKGPHNDDNGEASQVERMSQELKRIELFAQQFAKNVVDWARSMSKVVGGLRAWSISFGKVIGLSSDQGSEAFEAFLAVVELQLMPLCVDLEAIINERLLKEIAHLLKTMSQPYKLIASMQEQEPFHWHLLNMNVSAKNRPPPALLAASTNYLALRGQLAADLPTYLELLHRGMAISVRRLADIQTRFWKDVRDRWGELWEMLRVDGEMNAGHEETISVWKARWQDVDEVVASLNINQAKKIYQEPERARPPASAVHSMLSSLDPAHALRKPSIGSKHSSMDGSFSSHNSSYVSHPQPLAPGSGRSRGRTMPDTNRSLQRHSSSDSLFSTSRTTKGKSPRRKSEREESSRPLNYHQDLQPHTSSAIPRRKSMPLPTDILEHNPPGMYRRNTSAIQDGHGSYDEYEYLHRGPQIYHPYSTPLEPDDSHKDTQEPERSGRLFSRSSSSKRKSDSSKSRPSHSRQRSSSVTSFFKAGAESQDSPPVPPLNPEHDARPLSSSHRDSWVGKPAKYVCSVIHPCQPPASVSYFSFPFFALREGDLYEVLQEAGHPSIHPKLPLYVDDGEDCLLLCRDRNGNVGWALASFLEPINLPI